MTRFFSICFLRFFGGRRLSVRKCADKNLHSSKKCKSKTERKNGGDIDSLLPPDKFVGGYQWGNPRRMGDKLAREMWVLHPSWTGNHNEKISKFEMLGFWFLNESCPFYKEGTVPEHENPPYHIEEKDRNWVFPDSKEKKWW